MLDTVYSLSDSHHTLHLCLRGRCTYLGERTCVNYPTTRYNMSWKSSDFTIVSSVFVPRFHAISSECSFRNFCFQANGIAHKPSAVPYIQCEPPNSLWTLQGMKYYVCGHTPQFVTWYTRYSYTSKLCHHSVLAKVIVAITPRDKAGSWRGGALTLYGCQSGLEYCCGQFRCEWVGERKQCPLLVEVDEAYFPNL